MPSLVAEHEGVHLLDIGHRAEYWFLPDAKAVLYSPLEVADPDGDLRELVGVGACLYPVELLGADLREEWREPDRPREGEDLFFEIQQLLEAHVQEVPRPARRVEYAQSPQLFGEAKQERLRPPQGVPQPTAPRDARLLCLRPGVLLHPLPFPAERGHQDRLDDGEYVLAAGVVRPEPGTLVRIERAFEERTEDRRLHRSPVKPGRIGEQLYLVGSERHHVARLVEPAVEARNVFQRELSTVAHGLEESPDVAVEALRSLDAPLHYPREESLL